VKIEHESVIYEMPWRPNYEKQACMAWVGAGVVAFLASQATPMPSAPFVWMAAICALMFCLRVKPAWRLHRLQKHLKGRPLEFIELDKLNKLNAKHPDSIWLGYGFPWETRHAQRIHEILTRDWSTMMSQPGSVVGRLWRRLRGKAEPVEPIGVPWIHGVEPQEQTIRVPLAHTEGHILIVGTTGAGKTRLFDLLISQAIMRGEAVIIIDPKGDRELLNNARRACEAAGQPERFIQFHPAFPEASARIDPLRNFSRVTEIASRIAALIPSEAGADPFKSFGWQALNNIAQGLVMTYDRPNLIKLRHYLEGGAAMLVVRSVQAYAQKHLPDAGALAALLDKAGSVSREKLAALHMRFYREKMQDEHPSPELEGLLNMFEHDSTHFSKMVANLLPIMNMLTSGEIGKLLSPDPNDFSDTRPITDLGKIINNAQVAYIGLDSLTDSMVGSAIGALYMADAVAVAGDRYNYGVSLSHVNIFVDEAAEVINEPVIQALNKGRGALFRLHLATQTISDFVARLGNKDKAMQVLGNINNTIALRVIDPDSQTYIAENLPKTRLKYVVRDQGHGTESNNPIAFTGSQGERLMGEEGDLFPAQLLGMLPNLEYVAKLGGARVVKGRLPILVEGGQK